MRLRVALVAVAVVAAAILPAIFSSPAGAANSTVTTSVVDATSGLAWSGTEVAGATAYFTAVVTGDGTAPAAGSLTYTLYDGSTCTGTVVTTDPVNLNSDGSVPDSAPPVALDAGDYSYEAAYAGDTNSPTPNDPGTSPCETFSVLQATPSTPTISNIPTTATFSDGTYVATVSTTGDGTTSVSSNSTTVCTASGLTVTYVTAGTCSLTAAVAAGTNYAAATGTAQTFTISQSTPGVPTLTNLPASGTYGGSFVATITQTPLSDGSLLVVSGTPSVCSVGTDGLTVSYVGAGLCTLTPESAAGTNYVAATGTAGSFTIAQAQATTPTITNIPTSAVEFAGFSADLGTTGDGVESVVSSTPSVCSVEPDQLTVLFLTTGTCTLTPSVATGANYIGATGSAQSFLIGPAPRGYWLVGSDGGIFSFGAAAFHGSMGGTPLQRPVVGITPTITRGGYWLVASDGGIFAFGDANFYGSLPGLGLNPAGSGLPHSLNAPIVGMVPSTNRKGYFMVASDGGVFAFGDAKFEGSCPGIGGCAGSAVAVLPDSTGNGYWLVTNTGGVYSFGDAPFYGAPGAQSVPVVNAVAMPDGLGYWILYANGSVAAFGGAANMGNPVGYVNAYNPANAIFPTADGKGYWVASTRGDVFAYGNAPWLGSMAGTALNGDVIAGFGF